ncbi:MAG: threonyl-tRNA synthetase editing domain-containing protein [Candidatus Njordarchaeales archaeon]
MRILLLYTKKFRYRVGRKSFGNNESIIGKQWEAKDVPVAFIHVEEKDVKEAKKVVERAVRILSWYARKTESRRIVLHSFAHLSSSKASPEEAEAIISRIAEKLSHKNFDVHVTPFGYFLKLEIAIGDEPISRVFQEF